MIFSWWVIAFVPIAWFVQNCIHELSHLIVGWFREGMKPLGFYPYPHRHNGTTYFARYRCTNSTRHDEKGYRHIAPFYFGLAWALITLIVFCFLSKDYRIFVLPFTVCGLVDAGFFWWGYKWGSYKCDGKKYRSLR